MALRRFNCKLFWMLLLVVLAACSREGNEAPLSSPTNTVTASEPTQTIPIDPTATAEPTIVFTPTPIIPTLQVQDQVVTEDGLITIDSAAVPQAGWLSVYQILDGDPGLLLNVIEIAEGNSSSLTLEIDPQEASPMLMARLHVDDGTIGEFEYPGADMPFTIGSQEVSEQFEVDIQLPVPSIEMNDQDVGKDSTINVDRVFTLEPGWLVIHNVEGDRVGPVIGQIPIEAGRNEDLNIVLHRFDATEKLIAVLYEDAETPGGFDPEMDLPVLVNGNPVINQFEVTLPPDILAYDQPVIDGKIIIERAVSDGPGWITAYLDEDGEPGLITGVAPLADGLNENVALELTGTATNRLFLNLHEDLDPLGEFDFPASDLPLIFEGEVVEPFVVHTNPGNYLVTKDQILGDDNQITIPAVVADLATWLVLYTIDEEGQPAEVLAETRLPAGINRNIQITLPSTLEDEEILAILHQDAGTPEEFDYPGGVDIPLMRNRSIIQSPINILLPADSAQFIPQLSD